jgi:hypothetical protein
MSMRAVLPCSTFFEVKTVQHYCLAQDIGLVLTSLAEPNKQSPNEADRDTNQTRVKSVHERRRRLSSSPNASGHTAW